MVVSRGHDGMVTMLPGSLEARSAGRARPAMVRGSDAASSSAWSFFTLMTLRLPGQRRRNLGGIGDLRGGSLEPPRRWRGAQWPGLYPGSAKPPRATTTRPEEAQGASLGHCQGGTLNMLLRSKNCTTKFSAVSMQASTILTIWPALSATTASCTHTRVQSARL